ncbi:MDR family MFS transporter [Caldalkalibacillus salinus]|uniref:MDR family MFS transporter n=1 Tax=Caldalkalibacillus salinus TaxID=2803787 RepID=UPI001923BC27|nr:MDR family MFS transporter [Caldalkalibacillus salinus]
MNEEQVEVHSQAPVSVNVKRAPIMISLIIGGFFAILNETLLNVALTELSTEFGVTANTIQWLTTGFMLVVGILVPITALLSGWFTTRQLFIGAMTLFTVGTIISGVAPAFPVLLIGRLVQASGTGLLIPVMMNTILHIYPPEKRGGAMGMVGLVIMFAPAIGPTLSGLIVEALSWRWLFFIVIPFALFSIAFSAVFLKNVSTLTKPKVDILSIVFSTLGFGGIVYGFSSAGEGHAGFSSPEVYLTISIGFISLLLFVMRQLKLEEPMLDVRAFKSPMFSLTAVLLIIVMMSMFSTMIILPMFLQSGLVLSAFVAGLALLPGGVLNGLMSPVAGKLFDKFGPRMLIIPGSAILSIVLWLFTQVTTSTTLITFIVLHSLLMISVSLIMMPAQTNGLNQLPKRYYAHGTAILNTLQQVGGAIGIALFISIMTAGSARYLENVDSSAGGNLQAEAMTAGVQTSFQVALVFALAAFILTLFIKRTEAPEETLTNAQS